VSRVGRLLNTSVEVWRETGIPDGYGGEHLVWTLQDTHRARLSQPSARERTAAQQAGADLTHIVYFASGSDVQRGDQIRTGDQILDVDALFEPSVTGTYLRADCTARQPANGS
jgi:SPP1 family predicted phage head-tail adaptor